MQEVCKDLDGVSSWYYNPEDENYYRMNPEGEVDSAGGSRLLAHLHGRDIPSPDRLWQNRCAAAGTTTNAAEGQKFRPTTTTYSLYAHWQGVNNA